LNYAEEMCVEVGYEDKTAACLGVFRDFTLNLRRGERATVETIVMELCVTNLHCIATNGNTLSLSLISNMTEISEEIFYIYIII
jgi:hypothetical protein